MRLRHRRSPAARRYAAAGRPAVRTPWEEARWCAVDLELTGLDPGSDHIIAVGLVPVSGGRIQLGGAEYSLVASDRRSSAAAIHTHRLRREELSGAPPLAAAIDLILDGLAGRVPVFHHAAVEQRFLAPHLARAGLRMPPAVDTEQLGRAWLARREREHARRGGQNARRGGDGVRRAGESAGRGEPDPPEGLSLSTLSRALGQRPELAHHALGDAISTAQAFIALAALLGADGPPQTVGTLLGASVRTAGGSGRAPIG